MSIPFSFEELAHIRDGARRLAAGAADHERELAAVVRTAETDVRQAEAAQPHTLASAEFSADELQRLLAAHVRRALESTGTARRATISPHDQHVTARRLVSRLNDAIAVAVLPQSSTPDVVLVAVQNVARV
jgi:hypothetical protein